MAQIIRVTGGTCGRNRQHIYMEALEEKALLSAALTPKTWVRYVDDASVV